MAAKKESEGKVPLEKKLDKRGLLDLGYGYGINGLDVGYLGGGHLGGAHLGHLGHLGGGHLGGHALQSSFGHIDNGWHGYGQPHESFLGGHVDTVKTVTLVKGVPVPYAVEKHIPYPVEKHVAVPVKVISTNLIN